MALVQVAHGGDESDCLPGCLHAARAARISAMVRKTCMRLLYCAGPAGSMASSQARRAIEGWATAEAAGDNFGGRSHAIR